MVLKIPYKHWQKLFFLKLDFVFIFLSGQISNLRKWKVQEFKKCIFSTLFHHFRKPVRMKNQTAKIKLSLNIARKEIEPWTTTKIETFHKLTPGLNHTVNKVRKKFKIFVCRSFMVMSLYFHLLPI